MNLTTDNLIELLPEAPPRIRLEMFLAMTFVSEYVQKAADRHGHVRVDINAIPWAAKVAKVPASFATVRLAAEKILTARSSKPKQSHSNAIRKGQKR